MSPEFESALKIYLELSQAIVNRAFEQYEHVEAPILEVSEGQRYVRIVRAERSGVSRSAFAFIDKTNGNVLKPASWKTPAKHARGNIFDEFNGVRYASEHGPAYLR